MKKSNILMSMMSSLALLAFPTIRNKVFETPRVKHGKGNKGRAFTRGAKAKSLRTRSNRAKAKAKA